MSASDAQLLHDRIDDGDLLERIEHTRRENIERRVRVASDLRDAIRIFNAQPISVSAIDFLRERVLLAA